MKVGVIGAGRMGRILAERIATEHEVVLYDANIQGAAVVAESLKLMSADSLSELNVDAIVMAVPDSAVAPCLAALHETGKVFTVFSVATNISRETLTALACEGLRCLNVKIIGHAGEMGRGAKPVIVIDRGNSEMVCLAQQLFAKVGHLVTGDADQVKLINGVATEEALKAAVSIEKALMAAGISDALMIQGALSQVAPGVLKAYSEDDLGPFARKIVNALRDSSGKEMV